MARLQTVRSGPPVVRFAGVTVKLWGNEYIATAPYYLKRRGNGRTGNLRVRLGANWTHAGLRAAVAPKLSATARAAFERSLNEAE